MSSLLFGYVLKAAKRDKFIVSLFVMMALATSLSIFMGGSAVTEIDQFAAVFAAGSIRLLNVFGLCLFVAFFVKRSFDSRDVEYLLTRPVGRLSFLLSYASAFIFIGILAAIFSGLCVYALSPHLFSANHIYWIASLSIENAIMVCTAFFFAMVLASPALSMFATLGFYVLARMMAHLLGIIDSQKADGPLFEGLSVIMQGISMVMPRLDLLTQSSWLLYGLDASANLFIVLQGAVYIVLILSAAAIDLLYRRF